MPPLSLLDALADVPDPRSRHGRRHPLLAILSLTVLAMLRGCRGPTAIAQFGRDHGFALAHALGFLRGKTPAASCLSDLFGALDAHAFEAALSRWVAARAAPDEGGEKQSVSLDGKTLRGSRDGAAPGQHLVAAYAHEHQAVLAQIRVDAKTNEHKAALELLGLLPVKGRVVLGDAMFCQRDLCAQIVGQGGDYLFTVKGNQQGLETDIAAGFGFEAGARSIAAAFSPRAAPAAGTGAGAYRRGEGARPGGEADGADDVDPDAAREMAGAGAGARNHAGADGEGEDDGGSGLWDDQPQARGGRRAAPVGLGARALGDRERFAPCARRDAGGGRLPGAQGVGPASAGGGAQRRHPPAGRRGRAQPRRRHPATQRPPRGGAGPSRSSPPLIIE